MPPTCEELYENRLQARKQVGRNYLSPAAPDSSRVWREVAADAVGKGVCVYTQRLYEGYDKLYHQTPGEMYMEEVTADDIRLALVPLSKKSEGLYNKVNMLLKCIFYTAERNQILEHNPCAGISGKGGKPQKRRRH